MNDSKHLFTSKTIAGVIILLIPAIKSVLGIEIEASEINTLSMNIDQIVDLGLSIFGGIMAIFGRINAKHKLTI